ncbi:harmonin-like isoform X2 [Asterias amurensis]
MKMEETSGSHAFQLKIKELIEAESERDLLFQYLRDYQTNHEVSKFVDCLGSVVSHPHRVVLFDQVRPFIQPSQQALYNQLIPSLPSKKMRSIHFDRQGSESLGFSLRGGVEFDVGVFVSKVTSKSWASQKGLKVGDEIVRVNGYNIKRATHSEVIAALSISKIVKLKVRRVGMLPEKTERSDQITWRLVGRNQNHSQVELETSNEVSKETDRKVFVNLQTGKKLGCGIGTGQNNEPGIFILTITNGSLAQKMGLQVGDQILDVNGTNFLNITHDAAVMELKSSSQLTISLRSKKVMDSDALPLEKSKYFLAGADVSSIPKQSPETGENQAICEVNASQDKAPAKSTEDNKDDKGKESLSSNWSFKATSKSERYRGFSVEKKTGDSKGSALQQPHYGQGPWWSKDPYTLFSSRVIDGRTLCKVEIVKDRPLQMLIEGGIGSPLAGRIVVSEIYADGAAQQSGAILKGDQLMMVDGKSMVDISLKSAQDILKEAMTNMDGTEVVRLITAVSPLGNDAEEV